MVLEPTQVGGYQVDFVDVKWRVRLSVRCPTGGLLGALRTLVEISLLL